MEMFQEMSSAAGAFCFISAPTLDEHGEVSERRGPILGGYLNAIFQNVVLKWSVDQQLLWNWLATKFIGNNPWEEWGECFCKHVGYEKIGIILNQWFITPNIYLNYMSLQLRKKSGTILFEHFSCPSNSCNFRSSSSLESEYQEDILMPFSLFFWKFCIELSIIRVQFKSLPMQSKFFTI